MPHVITSLCLRDGGCQTVCPVECIVAGKPEDKWPIEADIFDQTYMIVAPGFCVKRALTWLVPLEDVTNGDKDQIVSIHALEGIETVRAGDFFLAKGVKEEIWPYPKEKAAETMRPAE